MDTKLDIERQKYIKYKEEMKIAIKDRCESCSEHNEKCPYYDIEEESWDYEDCYENE